MKKSAEGVVRSGQKLLVLLEKYKFVLLVILTGVVLLTLPDLGGSATAREQAAAMESDGLAFDLAALDIHGCRGCLGGRRGPRHPCVQRDGMDAVYPAYMAADVVVLASPMYYWSISGQLKCAFDRLFAVAELGPDLANPVKDKSEARS